MTRIVTLSALVVALLVSVPCASADPRPTGTRTTCDHAGIESATHHRRVDYLHQQYGLHCSFAQHVAKIWVHGCASPFSGCNIIVDHSYWYCTASSTTSGYVAACRQNGNTVLIGWVRF